MTIQQFDIESEEEYKKIVNNYQEYATTFAEGYVTDMFSQGIISEVTAEQLKEYFCNPDRHQEELEKLAEYFYISSAEIRQLYDLIEALPTLNYKLDSFVKSKQTDKYIGMINKTLHKLKHKRLTRDLLKQTATAGNTVGIWLGDSKNPYPYVFSDVKYVYPTNRFNNGEWVCVIDMEYFSKMPEVFRKTQLKNLSPYVEQRDYDNYVKYGSEYKLKELPQNRTFVLRTGTQKRNQGLGTSWVTSGLYDVLHKKKLKDVERSIANKIINAVAVLTVGTDKMNGEYTNLKLNKSVKKAVHNGVKTALSASKKEGVSVVTIPDFASIEFPDIKADGLDGKKFDHINTDIQTAYGISGAMMNGAGSGTLASSKMNETTFYKRVGVLLEDIEQEAYQKLINLILPESQKDNFFMTYDKEAPLTHKEKLDVLVKMNDKGWSTKAVIDQLSGVSWEQYLEQTVHETDELKLQEKIKPYSTSHTQSGEDGGRPEVSVDDVQSEGTMKTKTNNPV